MELNGLAVKLQVFVLFLRTSDFVII